MLYTVEMKRSVQLTENGIFEIIHVGSYLNYVVHNRVRL